LDPGFELVEAYRNRLFQQRFKMTVDRQRHLAKFAYGSGFLVPFSESQWPNPAETIQRGLSSPRDAPNVRPSTPELSAAHSRRMRECMNTVYAAIGVVERKLPSSSQQPALRENKLRFASLWNMLMRDLLYEICSCWLKGLRFRLFTFSLQNHGPFNAITGDYSRLGIREFLFGGVWTGLSICVTRNVMTRVSLLVQYGLRRLVWANFSSSSSRASLDRVAAITADGYDFSN
jgi:hypothetical protein